MAGVTLQTRIDGFDELAYNLKNSPQKIDDVVVKMLKMAAMITQAEAKEKAPVDTSFLRKSILYQIKGNMGDRFAEVGTNVKYAVYQEFGTGIYGPKSRPITPKRGRFLVFRNKEGKLILAKKVRGVKPKKFMMAGIEKLREDMRKVLDYGKSLMNLV